MITWHKHHIVPKHAGGTDGIENIIKVNVAMHTMLHKIRYEETGDNYDKIAYQGLSGMIGKDDIIREIRLEAAFRRRGWKHTDEFKQIRSEKYSGSGNPFYGKTFDVHPMQGKLHSNETKESMSNTKKGSKNPMFGKSNTPVLGSCKHCNKTMDVRNLARYHNDNCKMKE